MSLQAHFENLGAPLRNSRWSWGSVRQDGKVVLRVWACSWDSQDRVFQVMYPDLENASPGYDERMEHLNLIRNGSGYILILVRENENYDPERGGNLLGSYDRKTVFVGTEWLEGGDQEFYLKPSGRRPVHEFFRWNQE